MARAEHGTAPPALLRAGAVTLDRLLARLHRHEAALPRVLGRPEIPPHTNGSENDVRACLTKRKISGGTMSEAGRTARAVILGLMKTCARRGVSSFRYLASPTVSQWPPHRTRSDGPQQPAPPVICPGVPGTALTALFSRAP